MTERGLPSPDGAPACPFVAFVDDRDTRSTSPDHRHRCFAESPPAPRAVAHQEAYCLSSAFPVCPTFQEWARREAARASGGQGAPAGTGAAGAAAATGIGAAAANPAGGATDWPPAATPDPAGQPDRDAAGALLATAPEWQPSGVPQRRNPPRDWAAPPPWATSPTASSAARVTEPPPAPDAHPDRSVQGRGLAGSPADVMAGGSPPPGSGAPGAPVWSASAAAALSAAPDEDLAGLVGGSARNAPSPPPPAGPPPAPPPARPSPPPTSARPPQVSPARPRSVTPGPSWERGRRYEAYPTIRTRTGLPGLPRIAVLAGAVAIAALALFFLPALFGIGGGGGGASPSPGASGSGAVSSVQPSPTASSAPSQQTYVVKQGDTMSKIAKKYGVTIDDLCNANKATIKDCNKIAIGDELVIPAPTPQDFTDTPAPSSS